MNRTVTHDLLALSPVETAWDAQLQESAHLQQRIRDALHDSPCQELRNINCEVRGDMVCLSGHVSSYYLKQLAQECVARMLNYRRRICNDLSVIYSEAHAKPTRR